MVAIRNDATNDVPRRAPGHEVLENSSPRGTAIIPNLITMGNAVCGFVALTLIAGVQVEREAFLNPENLSRAAWFILLGMVFDVFDGRVARMTGGTSSLGAQLDSLADLVTFGIAPAGLLVIFNQVSVPVPAWSKIVWVFSLAYFVGALLRLARFNVEHDHSEGKEHLCFRGLPTPAAAGTVSGLVLVYFWLKAWKSWELRSLAEEAPLWLRKAQELIPVGLPFLAFFLGYAMVSSRLTYPHVANQLFTRHSTDFFALLLFAGILTALMVEPILCILFLVYMAWPPMALLVRRLKRGRSLSKNGKPEIAGGEPS